MNELLRRWINSNFVIIFNILFLLNKCYDGVKLFENYWVGEELKDVINKNS